MLDRGVYLPCSQYEAMFISAAHTEADVDATVAAAREALAKRVTRRLNGFLSSRRESVASVQVWAPCFPHGMIGGRDRSFKQSWQVG